MKKYAPKVTIRRRVFKANLVLDFGNKCKDCGMENLPIDSYVFHHHSEKMNDKEYRLPSKIITMNQKHVTAIEKVKWVLLCANCHGVRHGCGKTAIEIINL